MVCENRPLLDDKRWDVSGTRRLYPTTASTTASASLLAHLTDPQHRTRTGQLRAGATSIGGYSSFEDIHVPLDPKEQAARTIAISRTKRAAARQLPGFSALLDFASEAVADAHGAPLEWLVGHILDQTSAQTRFEGHQDTEEQYTASGRQDCEVLYTITLQLAGASALEVISRSSAEYETGGGFLFNAALWHRTAHADGWKVAFFFGLPL